MSGVTVYGNTLTIDGFKKLSVLFEDGLITKVSNNELSSDENLILTDDQLLAPAIVNGHAHARDMNQADQETIATFTKHSLKTGKLEEWLMPNTNPLLDSVKNIKIYQKIIERDALVNCHVIPILKPGMKKETINDIINLGLSQFKVFIGTTTGTDKVNYGPHNINQLIKDVAKLPDSVTVGIHLELGLKAYKKLWDPKDPYTHYLARPNIVEKNAGNVGLKIAETFSNLKFIFHHLSTKELLQMHRPSNVRLEFTPHYAYFNNQSFNYKSYLVKCNPSLKTEKDRQAIEQGLFNGLFSQWGDDHAPHTFNDKWGTYDGRPYSGMPSYSGGLLGEFINRAGNDSSKLANILRTYTKTEWFIEEGNPAKAIIIDLSQQPVKLDYLATKARYVSPYVGEQLPFISMVFNGTQIIQNAY